MENEVRYTERLAKTILIAGGAAVILALCWLFRNVISYILAAVVVSLIAKPLVNMLPMGTNKMVDVCDCSSK